jgi:hypothetical protein
VLSNIEIKVGIKIPMLINSKKEFKNKIKKKE